MDTETTTTPNFLILQQEDISQALQSLTQDEPRKKRVHRKSRLGCIACKRRRVKCNEQIPCSNCIKRKEQCLHSTVEKSIPRSLSTPRAHFANPGDVDSPINLMHLRLLHHFEHFTVPTLSFPEVWPVVLRQAFDEEFIMSTILCVSATHLATMTPNNVKYNRAKNQLLTKSLRLLRLNLSRPFTKHICDALAGTTVLINYISWCHLDFLSEPNTQQSPETNESSSLDLSQDQLFLLSPGVLQVYLQGLPVFMEEDSVFLQIGRQHPRIDIEKVLISRGEDPTRFIKPFMKMFDDPQFQTSHTSWDSSGIYEPFRRTWAFLNELEVHMGQNPYSCSHAASSESAETLALYHDTTIEGMRDALLKLHADHGLATPQSQSGVLALGLKFAMPQRTAFERVARRLSPVLCCLATPRVSAEVSSHSTAMPKRADLQRLLFTFPVFCCGPMLEMIAKGDARALVLLFHFYRAVRVLLPTEETWWAAERSRRLEGLILAELEGRGYKDCLRMGFETL